MASSTFSVEQWNSWFCGYDQGGPAESISGLRGEIKPHATTPQQKSQPAAGIHCAHFSYLLHAHAVETKSADASRACRWHLVSNPKAFSGTLARHFERMFRAMPKSCNYQCDCTLLPQKSSRRRWGSLPQNCIIDIPGWGAVVRIAAQPCALPCCPALLQVVFWQGLS